VIIPCKADTIFIDVLQAEKSLNKVPIGTPREALSQNTPETYDKSSVGISCTKSMCVSAVEIIMQVVKPELTSFEVITDGSRKSSNSFPYLFSKVVRVHYCPSHI
jgi:hypothetical protein